MVTGTGLNGDLTQGSGNGNDIFLCAKKSRSSEEFVTQLFVSDSWSCPTETNGCGYGIIPSPIAHYNGDANQGKRGSADVVLCYDNQYVINGQVHGQGCGDAIYDIRLIENENSDHRGACPNNYEAAATSSSLSGDLNQGAGGKFIFLCYTRDPFSVIP
jgi:hypothetical protein